MQRYSIPLRIKADDAGLVSGYGARFNTPDRYGESFIKGAFGESLARHKSDGTTPALLARLQPIRR